MKKNRYQSKVVIAIAILFFGAGVLPVISGNIGLDKSVIDEDVTITVQNTIDSSIVSYQINDFSWEEIIINGLEYQRINLDQESNILKKGAPDLPNICRSVITSEEANVNLHLITAEYQEYENVLIAPSKGNLLRNIDPDEVPFVFNKIYSKNKYYPGKIAELGEQYFLRDYQGQVVIINPFQYNPVTKVLRVYNEITVEVLTGELSVVDVIDTDFKPIYDNQFINLGGDRYTAVEEKGNMLVITYDGFWDEMLPFVEWKNMKGIPTEMVRVSEIGNANAIKTYISNYYNDNGLTFVLLVGDAAQVPTLQASGGASDPSYSYIVGGDHYPDLFVGRFSAQNPTQLNTQIERTLEYEQDPQAGSWYHKGTGIGSNEGSGYGDDGEADWQHLRNIRTDILGFTYSEVDELYDGSHGGGDASGNPSAGMVASVVNDGRSFINYCGHGWSSGWVTTGFDNTYVNNLVNDNMLPFITSVACNNGEFDSYSSCFAETWMRATHSGEPTGAIGIFASSVSQSWAPPMDAQDEIVDLLVNNQKNTYGGLCFSGCMHMNDQYGYGGYEMTDTWNVFGDPSLQVRTDTPSSMTVQHESTISEGATSFNVYVVGEDDALCAISRDSVLLGRAYTDATGHATIMFDEPITDEGDLDLVVTAFNKIPYMASILVGVYEGIDIPPESYTIIRGFYVSGDLDDLFDSDDSRLIVDSSLTLGPFDSPVRVIVETTAPTATPEWLKFTLEAGAIGGTINQKIELYNYVTEDYEEVDLRTATATDSSARVVISNDPSRFVDQGTLEMKAHLSWKNIGPTYVYPWPVSIDQAIWTTNP